MSSESMKKILFRLSTLLPESALIPARRQRFIFPFWHAVSDAPAAHLSGLYQMPGTLAFEQDLDFLLKNYRSASVGQVEAFVKNELNGEEKLFFLSFDDGLSECYHTIAPILKRKGIQAAFFINPEFVGNKQLFHRHKASLILNFLKEKQASELQMKAVGIKLEKTIQPNDLRSYLKQSVFSDHAVLDQIAGIFGIDFNEYLKQNEPYMTLSQIQDLQNDGFLIGAHSLDHREFYKVSESEMIRQISESMDFVEQQFHPDKKWFAFPYTDSRVPDSVFEKAIQDKIWDLSFGTAGMKDESMRNHIQRIPMESGELWSAEKMIRMEYAWYAVKSVFGKNKVNRR